MALLADLETKRGELNAAIAAYTAAVQSGVLADISTTKATAQSVGDQYAKLISRVKQDDPSVTNDDQLFSNPARMNALVRDDIATIVTTGKLFGAGMKLLMDTEGVSVGATNVILSFAEGSAIDIDWGDGSAVQSFTGAASHNYAVPGQYTVEVYGSVNGFTAPLVESRQQLKDVSQWGEVQFASAERMFQVRTGFVISAADAPTFLPGASAAYMFNSATDFNGPIDHWDMSNVTNMFVMFHYATAFNQPLSGWNVSGVTNMNQTLSNTTVFNQDISGWTVSQVTDFTKFNINGIIQANYLPNF